MRLIANKPIGSRDFFVGWMRGTPTYENYLSQCEVGLGRDGGVLKWVELGLIEGKGGVNTPMLDPCKVCKCYLAIFCYSNTYILIGVWLGEHQNK